MPPKLRPPQEQVRTEMYRAWDEGARNLMPVLATGAGKTVLFSQMLYEEEAASVAIAHRQELVSQISISLARYGVRHRLLGNNDTLRRVVMALQTSELGYSFIDPNAKTGCGGIDTILRMKSDPWFARVRKGVIDEGHHVLRTNKWGEGTQLFPNALWILPTATPGRADGRGLGRHADGVVDRLILGPSMRDIIKSGYLTDYRIFCPPSDLDLSKVEISAATGDLKQNQMRDAVHKSTITGDVVKHYLRIAKGKLGVTFAADVEEAIRIAAEFRAAGIVAEVVSAKTPDAQRAHIIGQFKKRQVTQLVNVDLFGEGFDLPLIEVVSFARPTESFSLYSQQFGRVLRLMIEESLSKQWGSFSNPQRKEHIRASGKSHGLIIDHVGNVVRHGLPDAPRQWTLDRRERRSKRKDDEIPLTVCLACFSPFPRTSKRCPFCDHYEAPDASARSKPEYVDGDLTELDPGILAAMRGEIARKDGDFYAPAGLDMHAQIAARNHWMARQAKQTTLRNAIAWWAGVEAVKGHTESESYRRFFHKFGVDVAGAQLLNAGDAEDLALKVMLELHQYGIDGSVNAEVYFNND